MEEQAIVDVTVSTDFEDFKADLKHFGLKKPWAKLLCSVGGVLLAAAFAIAFTELYYGGTHGFWVTFYVFSLPPACFVILTVKELLGNRPAELFKTYQSFFHVDTERRYRFTENCMICTLNRDTHCHERIEVEYAHYIGAKESGNTFFLQKEVGTIILPKKCFTEEQITALHDFLSRKFGEKFEEI